MDPLAALHQDLTACRACPRLVAWREQVARERRAAYRDEPYWGKPVPGFGGRTARLLVVGLAPAAHGANRTGRMFTGDRSGAWLIRALHRAGYADRPVSERPGDGLTLSGCFVTAVVRCPPPGNRPEAAEVERCEHWLLAEISALPVPAVVAALGGLAYGRLLRLGPRVGWGEPLSRPRFAHGVETSFERGPVLIGSYHPSQQNTFTGRLTEQMLDAVFARARELAG
jgi:uracil-DNA glycosylase family 4